MYGIVWAECLWSQLPSVDVVAVDHWVGEEVVGEVEQNHTEDKQTHEHGSLLWLTIGNLKIREKTQYTKELV